MKNTILLSFFLAICLFFGYAQSDRKIGKIITDYFQGIRNNKPGINPDDIIYFQGGEKEILLNLEKYISDTLTQVRYSAYYIIKKIGQNSNDLSIRQKSVNYLLEACKDKDSGNSGLASTYLTNFELNDFNEAAKDSLEAIIKIKPAHHENLIKLAGYLVLSKSKPFLVEQLSNSNLNRKTKWAIYLALARMGSENEINYCLERAKRLTLNEDVVYNLIPDLIYTRQKVIFDYIIELLNSNDKNCVSANPESTEKIACGYRIMEYIAPVISDFPLSTGTSGDLITDDYKKALETVRDWFKMRDGQYTIKTNTY